MRSRVCGAIWLLCAGILHGCVVQAGVEETLEIRPDPELQRQLSIVAREFGGAEPVGFYESVLDFKPLVRTRPEEFFAQVLYFYCDRDEPTNEADADRYAMLAMLEYLALPPSKMTNVLVPYIYAENAQLRDVVRGFLGRIEGPMPAGCHNFRHYRHAVGEDAPLPLILYMFEQAPSAALQEMMQVHAFPKDQRKDLLWADYVISNVDWEAANGFGGRGFPEEAAEEQLGSLVFHDQWWVRLYAVEVLRKRPGYRTESIVDGLKRDEHALVRSLAYVVAGEKVPADLKEKLRAAGIHAGIKSPVQPKR